MQHPSEIYNTLIQCSTNLITSNVKPVKVLFIQRCLQIGNSIFFVKKTKRKDVIRRAPTSFENLIDRVKRFIQLDLTVFGLSKIDEGTGIVQTLTSNNAFITKVTTTTSMIAIVKVWLREYRSKVQKVLLTQHKLFPTNEEKKN